MADQLIGKTIGQYQIVQVAGAGGMATVYQAYQPSLSRYVALKVLPEALAHDQEFVARFKQEATAAASLRHPNILVVYDVGDASGIHYIATEFLQGQTLDQMLKACGPLPLARAVRLVGQIASALEAAHQIGIIHRDIKPSNIFIGRDDHVTLMDFGIAKAAQSSASLTRTGTLIGTPEYMSPEQAEGLPLDRRTDLYSLGVVVYHMLTGRPPFSAPTPNAILYAHVNKPAPTLSQLNPAIPPSVSAVVLRAMAKRADERFQSATEFARTFEQSAQQAETSHSQTLYQESQKLLQGRRAIEALAKAELLRQFNPNYPGLADLLGQINRQAQLEREYTELARLSKQVQEQAADLARRAPDYTRRVRSLQSSAPAPSRWLNSGVVFQGAGAGISLGGILGYWAIPSIGAQAWGIETIMSYCLEEATLIPRLAALIWFLAGGVGVLSWAIHSPSVTRILNMTALGILTLGWILVALLCQANQLEGPGPTLLLTGQAIWIAALVTITVKPR